MPSHTVFNGYSTTCSPRHCWEPHFNSKILEAHWKQKVTEFLHRRYRVALIFIGLFALLWIVFFSVQLPVNDLSSNRLTGDFLAAESVKYSPGYIIGAVTLFLITLPLLALTFWKHYRKIAQALSVILTLVLMGSSFALAIALHIDPTVGISTISFVAQFAISAVVVLVVYTLSRFSIWFSVVICFLYMVILETISISLHSIAAPQYFNVTATTTTTGGTRTNYLKLFTSAAVSRLLFHVALNVAGVTTAYLSQLRLHDTFWRIGQCVLARRLLDTERDIEEKTVHSLLPRAFADSLLSADVQIAIIINQELHRGEHPLHHSLLKPISIPFNFCSMDRVSILFADIVGFTKFSSSLSAADLVGILNEIFSEFDELAIRSKCEKVTTLGDSYICVSGCPKQDSAHADNVVEMGLSIVKSLDDYCLRTRRPIKMRIGVHSGSVICGVVGTKRFKFDVWSRDVMIANQIESVGVPGRVVISMATKSYLSSAYVTEDYVVEEVPPELEGMRLYSASRYRRRSSTTIGSTSLAWKQRIKEIESIGKGEEEKGVAGGGEGTLREMLRRRSSLHGDLPLDGQPSFSLRDSLSRQSHLQQCASYTEEANPHSEREDSLDRKIVDLMEAEKVKFDSYFDPRIRCLTVFFSNQELEARYRNHGRDLIDPQNGMQMELGYQLTKLSYLVDVVALIVIFLLIMVGTAVTLSGGTAFLSDGTPLYQSWLIILALGLITHIIILICVIAVYAPHRFPKWFSSKSQYLINWYVHSVVATYLIYYPMSMVIITLTQCYGGGFTSAEDLIHVQMSLYVTIIVLISSINFMKLSYIVKVAGGVCSCALTIILVAAVHLERCEGKLPNETTSGVYGNRTIPRETQVTILRTYYNHHIVPEALILFLLILTILGVVNSMSEVSVRLSFISRIEAAVNKQSTHQQKNQVEWLLYNIIPPHVVMELRNTGRYSRNHECVGVVFASIVNFGELRSGEGDEASFRLLNRIVREYDSLLDRSQFSHVDKIKTIGSTYMAASGLNLPAGEGDRVGHLIQLIDFSLQLHEVLRKFNILVPGFSFRLRIGFNYGPVTSGVVGSRKLMYDIWGDTVNVASRMESTGKVFKIHVPEKCLEVLGSFVTWEAHQTVDVKGKGSMKTVFVTGRK